MYHLFKSLYLQATSLPEYSVLLLGLDAAGKTTLLNQIRNVYGGEKAKGSGPWGEEFKTGEPRESAGNTVPTVGQNVSTIHLSNLYLRIWDVGGQRAIRSLWRQYYASCHAIVFVIDSADVGDADLTRTDSLHTPVSPGRRSRPSSSGGAAAAPGSPWGTWTPSTPRPMAAPGSSGDGLSVGRLEECAEVLAEILEEGAAAGVPLLVLANKQDREDSVEVVRIKEGFVRRVVEGEGQKRTLIGSQEEGEEVATKPIGRSAGAYVRDSRVLPCSALSGQGVKEAVEWLSTRVQWNKEGRPPVMR